MMSSNTDNISTYLRSSYHTHRNYTTKFFGQRLDVAVTSKPCSVRKWINRSLYIHRHRLLFHHVRSVIVGLGTQWCAFQSHRRPATIQICIGHRVLIFQIFHSRSIPSALSRLLSDRRITFVGYNIGYDCHLLRSCHGLVVAHSAELRSVSGMGRASMEMMAERFLGFHGVKKPTQISTSMWDALQLSDDQVQFAALDAYVSFLLGLRLVASPALTVRAGSNWEAVPYWGSGTGDSEEDELNSYSGAREGVPCDGGSDTEDSEEDESNSYSEKSGFYADHMLDWEGVPHFGSDSEEDELISYLEKSGFYADLQLDWEGVPHFGSDTEEDESNSYSVGVGAEKSGFYADHMLDWEGVPHYRSDSEEDDLNSYSGDYEEGELISLFS